ncbi:hypothetical protein DH2020_044050 [Rehmannia glutinosa]|uniref:RING-type E3 ubiquitin transferase n=1 Tax=Rehmannia glutinosa TaxID=99300 RepID=A0ABR0UI03_REHGL
MSPIVAASAAAKQAEQLRQDGNTYFKKDRFGAAIDAYTEAHYMLGLALLQKKEYAEGVKELEKALDLGRGANPKGYMVEEIWQELARAKYLEWEHESTKRSWELQNLKEACEAALKEKHFVDSSQREGFVDENVKPNLNQLEALLHVFNKAAEDDTPTEVPDYLCCKITLDIFRDPVITPSGVTYERAVILDHLQKQHLWTYQSWKDTSYHQRGTNKLAIMESDKQATRTRTA